MLKKIIFARQIELKVRHLRAYQFDNDSGYFDIASFARAIDRMHACTVIFCTL